MSLNIAVRHQDYASAVNFYSDVLGFKNRSTALDLAGFDVNPINLFVIQDAKLQGSVLELFVDNLDQARDYLTENRCRVLRWKGEGGDCYIQDPFGVIYNLWEK
jgi:hypothetical protein